MCYAILKIRFTNNVCKTRFIYEGQRWNFTSFYHKLIKKLFKTWTNQIEGEMNPIGQLETPLSLSRWSSLSSFPLSSSRLSTFIMHRSLLAVTHHSLLPSSAVKCVLQQYLTLPGVFFSNPTV